MDSALTQWQYIANLYLNELRIHNALNNQAAAISNQRRMWVQQDVQNTKESSQKEKVLFQSQPVDDCIIKHQLIDPLTVQWQYLAGLYVYHMRETRNSIMRRYEREVETDSKTAEGNFAVAMKDIDVQQEAR